MKAPCHKTSASQECCCDTFTLLTQGLNIKPLSRTHTRARALHVPKGRELQPPNAAWSTVCVYLSTLTCVLHPPPQPTPTQQSAGSPKTRFSLLLRTGAVQCNDSHGRHNAPLCVGHRVRGCACRRSPGSVGAGAAGSARVQHASIIHAFACAERARGASVELHFIKRSEFGLVACMRVCVCGGVSVLQKGVFTSTPVGQPLKKSLLNNSRKARPPGNLMTS